MGFARGTMIVIYFLTCTVEWGSYNISYILLIRTRFTQGTKMHAYVSRYVCMQNKRDFHEEREMEETQVWRERENTTVAQKGLPGLAFFFNFTLSRS